jgi:hypothetical protein
MFSVGQDGAMLYATEIEGRLHWAYLVERIGHCARVVRVQKKPLNPKIEATWRARPDKVTILPLSG